MIDLQPIFNHIGPFLMVLFRLSGLFLFAPLLSSSIIPVNIRVLIVFMFTLALYPMIPAAQQAPIHLDLFELAPAVFAETLIGLAIGLLAAMPMYAAQLGGQIMGQQAGFSLGQVFNPSLDTDADLFGTFMQYIAIFTFVAVGGLEMLFLSLAGTFARVPVGTASSGMAPLDLLVNISGSGFDIALRVSAPVLCIILVETVASSILMKTIPQINIQSLGFPVKIIAAMLALIGGVAAISQAIDEDTTRTAAQIMGWSQSVQSQPEDVARVQGAHQHGGR